MTTPRGRSVNPLQVGAMNGSPMGGASPVPRRSPPLLRRLSLKNRSRSSNNNTDSPPEEALRKKPIVSIKQATLRILPSSSRRKSSSRTMDAVGSYSVLDFLSTACPAEVVPKVLAFAGPQKTAALAKTNRHFRGVMQSEQTWRVLCEELYKWKVGDPEPESWAELYRLTPCVPVDYYTIEKALALASYPPGTNPNSRNRGVSGVQYRSLRVLVRPGVHHLKETVVIQAILGSKISIEMAQVPENILQPLADQKPESGPEAIVAATCTSSTRTKSLRNLMTCGRQFTSAEETDACDLSLHSSEWPADGLAGKHLRRAALVFRTRRSNEPAFRVKQGNLFLRDVDVHHNSQGVDIWNGNAAIQIQPPETEDERQVAVEPRPSAFLERVHVVSRSGRGIVSIDGGKVGIRSCAVTNCAATGIYIGGPGSQAFVEKTDVIRNGLGNPTRRGIARGHSGVYLEQGAARILDCNITSNTLTGVSVVSSENAILSLEYTDLLANGTYQLELPAPGSVSRQRCITRQNNMAIMGTSRSRSGLLISDTMAVHQQQVNPDGATSFLVV